MEVRVRMGIRAVGVHAVVEDLRGGGARPSVRVWCGREYETPYTSVARMKQRGTTSSTSGMTVAMLNLSERLWRKRKPRP